METLNTAFFFIIDKLVDLQTFFIDKAWVIGRTVLLIALLSAALNYALTGEGLKGNLIKIGKAVVFFIVIMGLYPKIIGYITQWTFDAARESLYSGMEENMAGMKDAMAMNADDTEAANKKGTYGTAAMKSEKVSSEQDPSLFFSEVIRTREKATRKGIFEYTVVAPAAALESVLLIAGECLRFGEEAPKNGFGVPDLVRVASGFLCALAVMATGILAVLEYVMAFLEYMLVTGVGIILFPLSLWEGSKFMTEKLIGAIIGFFVKLLFCNICMFMMLYGFLSLARGYTATPFTGRPDEILVILFVCFLFYYLSKSGPALAQSLLTGAPSLSAGGAIAAAGGAIAGASAALGLAGKAGGAIAGGAAKAVFGAAGAVAQATAAGGAAGELGGGAGAKAGAFMKSMAGSAGEALKSSGGDLTRSLLGGGGKGGGSGGGGDSGAGVNRHSQKQQFLGEKNADGTKKSFGEHLAGRKEAGTNAGLDYMAKQEERTQGKAAVQEQKAGAAMAKARAAAPKMDDAGKWNPEA